MILFDPAQYKEFGQSFYDEKTFSYRYQASKKLFFSRVYIPFGPICQKKENVQDFLEHCQTVKLSKIKVDLPLILDQEDSDFVTHSFRERGFTYGTYVQDAETIILTRTSFNPDTKDIRYYRKKAAKTHDIVIKDKLSNEELEAIYQLYLQSAEKIGYIPKPKAVFSKLAEHTLTSLAIEKSAGEIHGYVFGYTYKRSLGNFSDQEQGDVLQIMFAGSNENGRKSYVGYGLYANLIETSLESNRVKIVDLYGASRTQNRAYTKFKAEFGGEFVAYPGSFEKVNIL